MDDVLVVVDGEFCPQTDCMDTRPLSKNKNEIEAIIRNIFSLLTKKLARFHANLGYWSFVSWEKTIHYFDVYSRYESLFEQL